MSWSLPRLYLSPQRDSRSSELSVSRPLFCTAIFRRTGSGEFDVLPIELQPFGHRTVAAAPGGQIARNAADGGDADPRLPVDLTVGQAALQQLDHGPAVRHRLQFGRRAQVAEEAAAFLHTAQRQYGRAQRTLVLLLLPQGDGTIGFHGAGLLAESMY